MHRKFKTNLSSADKLGSIIQMENSMQDSAGKDEIMTRGAHCPSNQISNWLARGEDKFPCLLTRADLRGYGKIHDHAWERSRSVIFQKPRLFRSKASGKCRFFEVAYRANKMEDPSRLNHLI
jgi:hypothetical protein